MSRAFAYTLILAALITSLAFGETRLVTQPDVAWGPSSANETYTGGHVGGKIPRYFSTAAFTDNLALYGKSLTGDSTGNISGFDNVTNTGYGGTLRSGDFITKGPWVDVRAYGAVADDNVDDDTALVAATTEALSTGKPILFPEGQFNFANQWVISGDPAASVKPLTLIGAGSDAYSRGGKVVPEGGTILNFKYAGGPKIVGMGAGRVKIRGINFYNTGTDNNFFIYGVSTIWDIQNNSFWGGPNRNGGVQLGGDNTTEGFQGYGTIVSANYFQRVHKALYLKTWANGVVSQNNTVWSSSGGESAIELDPAAGPACAGNVITGWIIEMPNYTHGVYVRIGSLGNYFAGNGFYDPGATNKIYYYMPDAKFNTIIESYSPSGDSIFIDNTGFVNNTVIRNSQSQFSNPGYQELYRTKYLYAGNGTHIYYSGATDNTWSMTMRPYSTGNVRVWDLVFTSDNGAVQYSPFKIATYPDANWVNTTTDLYSDYTFRLRAAAKLELWGNELDFKDSSGAAFGYWNSGGLTLQQGTLNTLTGGSTTIQNGVGSIKMSDNNAATNTVWIPMRYNGNTYYVPGFTTNAP